MAHFFPNRFNELFERIEDQRLEGCIPTFEDLSLETIIKRTCLKTLHFVDLILLLSKISIFFNHFPGLKRRMDFGSLQILDLRRGEKEGGQEQVCSNNIVLYSSLL